MLYSQSGWSSQVWSSGEGIQRSRLGCFKGLEYLYRTYSDDEQYST